jgi:NAD-dependent SIR2 family protein deacetylase
MVNDEKGRRAYFRFYDPRIFRAVLPVCTPPEVAQLFGPIHRFLVESEDEGNQLLVYTQTAQGLNQAPLDLKKQGQAQQQEPTR